MAAWAASWHITALPRLVCNTIPVPLITGRRLMRLFSSTCCSTARVTPSRVRSGSSPRRICSRRPSNTWRTPSVTWLRPSSMAFFTWGWASTSSTLGIERSNSFLISISISSCLLKIHRPAQKAAIVHLLYIIPKPSRKAGKTGKKAGLAGLFSIPPGKRSGNRHFPPDKALPDRWPLPPGAPLPG